MARSPYLIALALLACRPPPAAPGDAGPAQAPSATATDAGWALTDERLTAWLRWQHLLAALPPAPRADAGALREGLTRRARAEAALLADAGLTLAEADRIEAVVSVVVAERTVEKLSGGAALEQFKSALAELSFEQKAHAEAAFAEASARAAASARPALEARFGVEAIAAIVTRESEVTKTWDSLLEDKETSR
jgi:hypothetical protein